MRILFKTLREKMTAFFLLDLIEVKECSWFNSIVLFKDLEYTGTN